MKPKKGKELEAGLFLVVVGSIFLGAGLWGIFGLPDFLKSVGMEMGLFILVYPAWVFLFPYSAMMVFEGLRNINLVLQEGTKSNDSK